MSIGLWIYDRAFDSIPSVYQSVFMPKPCDFYYYSTVVELEIRDGDTLKVLWLYRVVLAICEIFHMKLNIVLSRSIKNYFEILLVIALNL